jgi:hypothetical protein
MEDEEDEKFLGLEELNDKIASVESCGDFIEFLEMLNKEILDDDEVDKRLQLEFFDNIRRKLNFSQRFPEHSLLIECPDQPDWNWLARLFKIGAFEN